MMGCITATALTEIMRYRARDVEDREQENEHSPGRNRPRSGKPIAAAVGAGILPHLQQPMKPFLSFLAVFLVTAAAAPAFAADPEDMVSISRSHWENLQLNAREFQRLTNEIASLKAEIKKLKGDSNAASPAVAAPVEPKDGPVAGNALSTPDMATLPVLTPETVVSVVDLISHFQKDPVAAEARYKKRSFVLQGVVAEIDKSTTSRNYDVIFRQPGTALKAKIKITPPTRTGAAVLAKDGGSTEGGTSDGNTRSVEVGQTVSLTSRCETFSKDTITLSSIASDKK